MADELSLNLSAVFSKGLVNDSFAPSASITVSGTKVHKDVASIPTSDTVLDLGSIANPGYILLQNIDGTNFIKVGFDGVTYGMKLKAGEPLAMRIDVSADVHVKADTAACEVFYCVIED